MSSAETASTTSTSDTAVPAEPTATCPTVPLAAAVFPSMAQDRVWEEATGLDLLDLANAAVRRLEAIAWLIGEAKDGGGAGGASGVGEKRIAGIAELLEDVAVALRVVVGEMERRLGPEG